MAKILQIIFALIVAAALCAAEAPRSRRQQLQQQPRRVFSARQVVLTRKGGGGGGGEGEGEEQAEQPVTAYPAAGFKPEVPFKLPSEPGNAYLPPSPDTTYGPPSAAAPEQPLPGNRAGESEIDDDEAESGSTPEQQPLPPAVDDYEENEIDESAEVIPSFARSSSRLVRGRRVVRPARSGKLQQQKRSERRDGRF